jgi:NTP pyrophosphatase (non-canonical NTP hydrolase)
VSITFDEYQEAATTTAVYPGQGAFQGLVYAVLGLSGEAGETAEQVKKTWRDDGTPDIGKAMMAMIDHIELALRTTRGHTEIIDEARIEASDIFCPGISPERKQKILKELGDVFWYAAQVCTELGADMGDVAQANLDKLATRKAQDKIHGEGSDR